MPEARVTAEYVDVLIDAAGARVSSEHVDVLIVHPTGARVTAQMVDVIAEAPAGARVTWGNIDVLTSMAQVARARITAAIAELVVEAETRPAPSARLTAAVAELVVEATQAARITGALAELVVSTYGLNDLGSADTTLTFGVTATLGNVGLLPTGAADLTFDTSGDLTKLVPLSGTADLTFSTSATLSVPIIFAGSSSLTLDATYGARTQIHFGDPGAVPPPALTWHWCPDLDSWWAHYGPVPPGFVFPAQGDIFPNLLGIAPVHSDIEIDLLTGPDATWDPCGVWSWDDDNDVWWNGWDEGGTPEEAAPHWNVNGTSPPSGPHLFIIHGGPNWDETDPEPDFDPAVFFSDRPVNDDFEDAFVITTDDGTSWATNVGATFQPGEWFDDFGDPPVQNPDDLGDGQVSVWWRWTAADDGTATFDSNGSIWYQGLDFPTDDLDTIITVYTGPDLDNLTQVVMDDDTGEEHNSLVSFEAVTGTTYHIRVNGYSTDPDSDYWGSISLNWTTPGTYVPPTGTPMSELVLSASASLSGAPITFSGQGDLFIDVPFRIVFRGNADLDLTTPAGTVVGSPITFAGSSSLKLTAFNPLAFAPYGLGREYRFLVVNKTGNVRAELVGIDPGVVEWELNGPGSFSFSTLAEDANALTNPATHLRAGREIQVWRGDQLLWWGPLVRPQITEREGSYQCTGLLWYFTRRFFGKADRTNLVLNGDFADGIANWTPNGGVGIVVDNQVHLTGTRSVKLVGTSFGHNQYLSQEWVHPPGGHPSGDLVTIAAWLYVPSALYEGMAIDGRGLYARHWNPADPPAPDGYRSKLVVYEEISRATTKNAWIRQEIEIPAVKPGDHIEIRLYPPHGPAWYDSVSMTFMESLSFGDPTVTPATATVDQARIVEGIVLYAQDRFPGFTHGKSDLNIGTHCPDTGVRYARAYQFAEHGNIADALQEFHEAQYGVDMDIEITPTTRTFTTYHPFKGALRPELSLEYGRNVAGFTWSYDGEQAANQVVVLGAGDGPDREEGGATAPLTVDYLEGVTLETVISAPDGRDISILDGLAEGKLRLLQNPETLEVVTHEGAGLLVGALRTGDVVPVWIKHQALEVGDNYRAVRIALDPKTDTLTITLNKVDLNVLMSTMTTPPEIVILARMPNVIDGCRRPAGGVWLLGSDGGVFAIGAPFYGSLGGQNLNAPAVSIAAHGNGGYWVAGADGGVFAFGDAPFLGSLSGVALNAPIIAIVGTPSGNGYWLLGRDGGIFSFGDAPFPGTSTGYAPANATDAVLAPGGPGVWVVASDGGVFAHGAPFHGSFGGYPLNAPMVAIVPHGRNGYWLVGADGGIFALGDAPPKAPYAPMIDVEYARGDRAITAAEPVGANGLILIADDGATYEFP